MKDLKKKWIDADHFYDSDTLWPSWVMSGQTIGLSREHHLFDPNSLSQMQNGGIPIPYLLAGSIGSNDVTCSFVPVSESINSIV